MPDYPLSSNLKMSEANLHKNKAFIIIYIWSCNGA